MPLVLQLATDPTVGEPWCDVASLKCSGCDDVDLESVIAAASELLHIASGRRYGTRLVTVRPQRMNDPSPPIYHGMVGSWLSQGIMAPPWLDLRDTGESVLARGYRLNGPVRDIRAIKVDGVTLSVGDYRVYEGRDLVRGLFVDDLPAWTGLAAYETGARVSFENIGWRATQDSTGATPSDVSAFWERIPVPSGWPCYQRLDLDDNQPNTWSVEYLWGKQVPWGGVLACQALSCALAKLVAQGRCGVPDRATQTQRQGVTTNLLDPKDFAKSGRMVFGVRVADLWVSAVNPSGGRRRSRIVGPDTPTGARA